METIKRYIIFDYTEVLALTPVWGHLTRKEFDVPLDLIHEYDRIVEEFEELQFKLRKLYNA